MAKSKTTKPSVVAWFMVGKNVVHEIVSDKSSPHGYAVKHGPGHYMAIPQKSIKEILEYGESRGFTAVAL